MGETEALGTVCGICAAACHGEEWMRQCELVAEARALLS